MTYCCHVINFIIVLTNIKEEQDMPRPTTKEQLLRFAEEQYKKLWTLIDSMSEEFRKGTFNFEDRDKNIRDILVHLYEWHNLLLNWVKYNQKGEKRTFLPEGYNWKTYPAMNVEFWKKHQRTSYDDAKKLLDESHLNVMELIRSFSDEQLFTKKYYDWTGTTSIGSYCVSATSSHYDWAIKKIKKHVKTSVN